MVFPTAGVDSTAEGSSDLDTSFFFPFCFADALAVSEVGGLG